MELRDPFEGAQQWGQGTIRKSIGEVITVEFSFIATQSHEGDFEEDFRRLCDEATSVKITLLGEPNEWASFSGPEAKEILGGTWPDPGNVGSIRRSVIDRMVYPMPKPEIPGGGGKSFDAQGQTRKPGSHKDNTGHK